MPSEDLMNSYPQSWKRAKFHLILLRKLLPVIWLDYSRLKKKIDKNSSPLSSFAHLFSTFLLLSCLPLHLPFPLTDTYLDSLEKHFPFPQCWTVHFQSISQLFIFQNHLCHLYPTSTKNCPDALVAHLYPKQRLIIAMTTRICVIYSNDNHWTVMSLKAKCLIDFGISIPYYPW